MRIVSYILRESAPHQSATCRVETHEGARFLSIQWAKILPDPTPDTVMATLIEVLEVCALVDTTRPKQWRSIVLVQTHEVGRPVARLCADGWTAEVTRVATDGAKNACSMLYSACWRATQSSRKREGSIRPTRRVNGSYLSLRTGHRSVSRLGHTEVSRRSKLTSRHQMRKIQ